ncbi:MULTISPECIES: NAD(P)-dependent oxidoreductase [unclassified Fusibacter]|uniref:NAD(P)-dependent oxidoreductase n=1 Tax=unclassified Fusibacter TaxID=2624464 RepID=UPI001010BE72|nr:MULTISPECIES: NAD(P)-dependent oxidoreductase [unclassified Fusibacter]MCK8059941.1 NAD(P)-binding domain-containing protein [Fusibacter sp. A2]NPE22083.1 dihydrofolate reductase [Fusibacter sp. A1]RXV60862.1 dihydrofolate reductase [Fusibacter sp. A1]
MHVVMTYDYGKEVIDEIESLGYSVEIVPESGITEEMDFSRAEVLICYDPFGRMNLSTLTNLKLIMLSSVGVDQVPEKLSSREGLIITNNRGGYSPPMGEWIVMMLLVGVKRAYPLIVQSLNRIWKIDTQVEELTDKQILFLGTGSIAQEAIKRLKGFGAYTIGMNRSGHYVEGFDKVIGKDQVDEYIKNADALVLCLPQTVHTEQFMDSYRLSLMKDDAILINISRGSVLDERALEEELLKGKFRFVALDVTKEEPLNSDSSLWTYDQVLITPHNSWVSEHRNSRRLEVIMKNLKRFTAQGDLINTVDIERGY